MCKQGQAKDLSLVCRKEPPEGLHVACGSGFAWRSWPRRVKESEGQGTGEERKWGKGERMEEGRRIGVRKEEGDLYE